MADNICLNCDVAIVGAGFAGALIANELSGQGIKVIVLEAGPGVQPNINAAMKRFYTSPAKVPESAYPPELFGDPGILELEPDFEMRTWTMDDIDTGTAIGGTNLPRDTYFFYGTPPVDPGAGIDAAQLAAEPTAVGRLD